MVINYILILKVIIVIVTAIIGYFPIRAIMRRTVKYLESHISSDLTDIISYSLFYGLYIFLLIVVLQSIGVDVSALLAAAGIIGIAIGFAAQTSLSNIISGIMLLIERPFKVGDVIRIDQLQGKVKSIDLLSIRLTMVDNRIVRIPNEHLIKNAVINFTAMAERMLLFTVIIDADQDSNRVIQVLEQVASTFSFRRPEQPVVILHDTASAYAIGLTVRVWVQSNQATEAQSAFIKACLDASSNQKILFYIGSKEL